METIKRLLTNPIVTGVLGLAVGLFIGLVVLGWWLFPVQWTDAAPSDLNPAAQEEYLRTCIEAFGYNGDVARAKACYESLGEGGPLALNNIVNSPAPQDAKLVAAFGSIALEGTAASAGGPPQTAEQPALVEPTPVPGATAFPLPEEAQTGGGRTWLTLICVGGLILAAIAGLIWLLNRIGFLNLFGGKEAKQAKEAETGEYTEEGKLIARNISSYQLGNDVFDEVFSIEAEGDFLGEYGVAIADATGVGGPKRVSAFEIWLFDKNHIPTTTKVLLSEQAYQNTALRQKLDAKGETHLARPDLTVVLETNTLRLAAQVIDMSYAQGAAGSYFERFVLELKVFQKGE